MNWKAVVEFFILFGGMTAVSFIVDKYTEGVRTVPFFPHILIIQAVFAGLALYLFKKERQKKAGI